MDVIYLRGEKSNDLNLPELKGVEYRFEENPSRGFFIDLDGVPCLRNTNAPKSSVESAFTSGSRAVRGKSELIFRACGDRKTHPVVWDISAGLAQDSKMLWEFGYQMTLFERNPWVYLLLDQGLSFLKKDQIKARVFFEENPITLNFGSFSQYDGKSPDVIYYDPMYPKSPKSAKSALSSEWLREIVGKDQDIESVLDLALGVARKRVVVKRPPWAPPIKPGPTAQFTGKAVRYDMYVPLKEKDSLGK